MPRASGRLKGCFRNFRCAKALEALDPSSVPLLIALIGRRARVAPTGDAALTGRPGMARLDASHEHDPIAVIDDQRIGEHGQAATNVLQLAS